MSGYIVWTKRGISVQINGRFAILSKMFAGVGAWNYVPYPICQHKRLTLQFPGSGFFIFLPIKCFYLLYANRESLHVFQAA